MKSIILKILFILFIAGIVTALILVYPTYHRLYQPNVDLNGQDSFYVCIPERSTFEDVKKILYRENYIIFPETFEWFARTMGYDKSVRAGRYMIKDRMNNIELVSLLVSGKQTAVRITINNIRTKQQLAAKLGNLLEIDSAEIYNTLNDSVFISKYGFNKYTSICCFVANTYDFYWTVSFPALYEKMYKYYQKFWTEERLKKAADMGLTPTEVITLASIVQAEQNEHNDEKPMIAGLYYYRYKIGMPLQADPTVIFALGDFSIKRVVLEQKSFISPYNTYARVGLPPGPIGIPDVSSIDAVLNYVKHTNQYMCAKEDFSGYHNFTNSFAQHQINAQKFQQALTKLNIKK